jgi:membrane protein
MRLKRVLEIAMAVLAVDAGAAALAKLTPASVTKNRAEKTLAAISAARRAKLPRRGWKHTLKRVYAEVGEHRVMAEAASVTYYALLAIFPAIASLISLYGLIADPVTIYKHLSAMDGLVPDGGMQIMSDQIKALTSAPHQALGFGFAIGLLTSLWSANAGVKSLFDALNSVYQERETRSFFRLTWLSFAFTLGALAFIILALFAVVAVPAILDYVGLGAITATLLEFGRWPVMMTAVMGFLELTYYFGPSRSKIALRWISWGSAFAGVTWIGASAAFSYYAAHFGSYNKTYGSLGAVVGFMTWIWISTIIVLVGAELNAELSAQATQRRGETAIPAAAPG